jgi:D-hexose-6-phosphate mutarotase
MTYDSFPPHLQLQDQNFRQNRHVVAEHFECIVCWLCWHQLLAVHSHTLRPIYTYHAVPLP